MCSLQVLELERDAAGARAQCEAMQQQLAACEQTASSLRSELAQARQSLAAEMTATAAQAAERDARNATLQSAVDSARHVLTTASVRFVVARLLSSDLLTYVCVCRMARTTLTQPLHWLRWKPLWPPI